MFNYEFCFKLQQAFGEFDEGTKHAETSQHKITFKILDSREENYLFLFFLLSHQKLYLSCEISYKIIFGPITNTLSQLLFRKLFKMAPIKFQTILNPILKCLSDVKKKSRGLRSGDLGGHSKEPCLSIQGTSSI